MSLHPGDLILGAALAPDAVAGEAVPHIITSSSSGNEEAAVAQQGIMIPGAHHVEAVASTVAIQIAVVDEASLNHRGALADIGSSRSDRPSIDHIVRLCQEYESGPKVSRRTFAKERGMSRSAFDRHWRNYTKGLYSRVVHTHKRRRVRESKYGVVERCLVEYILSDAFSSTSYLQTAGGDSSGRPALSWNLLQMKAVQIAKEQLGAEAAAKFKASPGWLHRVFERNDCLRPALLSELSTVPVPSIQPQPQQVDSSVLMSMQSVVVPHELELSAADLSRMPPFRSHLLGIPTGPGDDAAAAERAREEEDAVLRSLNDVGDDEEDDDDGMGGSSGVPAYHHHHVDDHTLGHNDGGAVIDHPHLHDTMGLEGTD